MRSFGSGYRRLRSVDALGFCTGYHYQWTEGVDVWSLCGQKKFEVKSFYYPWLIRKLFAGWVVCCTCFCQAPRVASIIRNCDRKNSMKNGRILDKRIHIFSPLRLGIRILFQWGFFCLSLVLVRLSGFLVGYIWNLTEWNFSHHLDLW